MNCCSEAAENGRSFQMIRHHPDNKIHSYLGIQYSIGKEKKGLERKRLHYLMEQAVYTPNSRQIVLCALLGRALCPR